MTGHLRHTTLGPTELLGVKVPIDLLLKVEDCAKANGLTMAEFVRQSLAEAVGMDEPDEPIHPSSDPKVPQWQRDAWAEARRVD